MREINEIRKDINAIDHEILKLFLKRMKCAEEVSDYKMVHGGQVLVPARETELMDTMLRDIPDELKHEYAALLRTTTRVSRKHQYSRMLEAEPERLQLDIQPRRNDPKLVYYGGLPASYADMACSELFPNAEKRGMDSWEDVFLSVLNGEADVGVVPVENSTAGTVNEVYDLLQQYGLHISHSHIKVIQHCICGCKGASLDTIQEVHSIRRRCASVSNTSKVMVIQPLKKAIQQSQRTISPHKTTRQKRRFALKAQQSCTDWIFWKVMSTTAILIRPVLLLLPVRCPPARRITVSALC